MSTTENIIEETQREAIINRPYNLAGSIKIVKKERFKITNKKIEYSESNIVPALMKLFMEALDNPIDVAIKGGCDSIEIKVDNKSIWIKDNGYGVSTNSQGDESILYKAFCKYNTSSNYQDKKGQGQKGVNGIGIKLCTTLSKKFEVISEDTNGRLKLTVSENNLNHTIKKLKKTGKTGVEVYFEPDFNIFDVEEINQEHIDKMYEYTLMQSLTYPEINFKFNGAKVSMKPNRFIKMLSEDAILVEEDDYFIAIAPSESGEFRQLSYINGLEISKGGSHIDYIIDSSVRHLREKIVKKYKNIKPSDIKNKLNLIVIGRNMKHIDWEGQVKDTIASEPSHIKEYFKDLDFNSMTAKILRNKNIIDPIIELYKMKEEMKKRKELASLKSPKKKRIKSDKYLPATKVKEYFLIVEGLSAMGGLSSEFGRTNFSYYAVQGKPLNVINASQSKFMQNKELKSLFETINQEPHRKILIATDQDLDGFNIRSLLFGFFYKYMPELLKENKIGVLQTPIIVAKNPKGKIVETFYSLRDYNIYVEKHGDDKLEYKYLKGLGSYEDGELQEIIDKDGFDTMVEILEWKEEYSETILDWLDGTRTDVRKSFILENEFDIAKI